MTETMIELAHRLRVETDHRVYGLGCRTVCSCGWASQWMLQSADDALRAGMEHIDTAVGPPDAMDALMSAMLDLQDDLAEVVMWLADNWSADLPTPALHGADHDDGSGGPVAGAGCWRPCGDEGALARAAERLGVPVRTDPGQDSYGSRFRRAWRRFGRVKVEIALQLTEEGS